MTDRCHSEKVQPGAMEGGKLRSASKRRRSGPWLAFLLALLCIQRVSSSQEGVNLVSFVAPQLTNFDYSSWENSADFNPCAGAWNYITCDPTGTFITEINFANLGVGGTINENITVTHLQQLVLSNNSLTGTLPPKLGSLTQLALVDVSNNNFSGALPAGFAKMPSLTLIVANNNFTGCLGHNLTLTAATCSRYANNSLKSDDCWTLPNCTINGHKLRGNEQPPPPAPPSPPPPPASGGGGSNTGAIVGGVVGGVVGAALIAAALIYWRWLTARRRRRSLEEGEVEKLMAGAQFAGMKHFRLADVLKATNNFSEASEIGEGGFGTVYRGRLPDGQEVAIKRLKGDRKKANDSAFVNELEAIAKARHKNLIRLEGFCIEKGERILVFPYLHNGSVADHLQGNRPEGDEPLPWDARMRIAVGTAEGLAHMHYDCDPKLVHHDVKAANILLNANLDPVVADFGLARLVDYDDTKDGAGVRGTIGHIAPECLVTKQTTEKTDVFSFGVFLLELVSGQGAYDLSLTPESEGRSLREWVVKMLEEKRVNDAVDQELKEYNNTEVIQMLQVAIFCMHDEPSDRPTMAECVTMLQSHELADRWKEWQKWRSGAAEEGDIADVDPNILQNPNGSGMSMEAFVLSGPR